MKIRTRIAPSPTGDPHVGTAYVALVNYCVRQAATAASSCCASRTPIRRAARARASSAILDSLHWLGLSWNEGPDVGGPHGPYRQSERSAIYQRYARRAARWRVTRLSAFARRERFEEMREAQRAAKATAALRRPVFDLSARRGRAPEAAGEPFVVRAAGSGTGACVVRRPAPRTDRPSNGRPSTCKC